MRRLAIALAALPLVAASPAEAKVIRWGSDLKAAATQTIPGTYQADAEFWSPAVRAPRSGRILKVLLKTGDDSAAVPLRFTVVKPLGGGRFKVLTTSTPHLMLRAHSPGIHTFDFRRLRFKMPINRGNCLAIATPGVRPSASIWYGAVGGALVHSFTSRGATQNPGYTWTGKPHSGVELLMRVVQRTGKPYHFHLPR